MFPVRIRPTQARDIGCSSHYANNKFHAEKLISFKKKGCPISYGEQMKLKHPKDCINVFAIILA